MSDQGWLGVAVMILATGWIVVGVQERRAWKFALGAAVIALVLMGVNPSG